MIHLKSLEQGLCETEVNVINAYKGLQLAGKLLKHDVNLVR